MKRVSERQREMLAYIVKYMDEHKYAPTVREISDALGGMSTSVCTYNLDALVELGCITRDKRVSRSIVLLKREIDLWTERKLPSGGVVRIRLAGASLSVKKSDD